MTRVLVDTSVWIDHLRESDPTLVGLLHDNLVLRHPMVVAEVALGNLRERGTVIALLENLPAVREAAHDEVMRLIEARGLHGSGLGLVDTHLLASTLVTPGARLWTRDRRLAQAAEAASLAFC